MKLKIFLFAILLFSVYLTGCTRNNASDEAGNRNRNGMEPTKVNYNTRDAVPRVTDVRNNNRTNNTTTRMEVADRAAEKISSMPEIDRANVIVTDNNAYVAAKLDPSTKHLTNKTESKISDQVKLVDPDIDRVFVSVNPDFYDHMNEYADDIRSGRPVSGFFEEFSQMIQRMFPDVK